MTRATPEMIAAAWATWKPRNPKSLGPGPAFVEAINAALAKMEQPAMTQQEKTSNPAPATCDMCGGTGLYGPDAVNCPCGITPAPAAHLRVAEIADALNPERTPDGDWRDRLLGVIHADIESRGRMNPDFAVTVHHRNIVLSAVARALTTEGQPDA